MTDDDDDNTGTPLVVPETPGELQFNQWMVRSGDHVVKDQPIVSLMSDKIDVELEAPAAGVIVLGELAPDATVRSGDVLARVEPPPPVDAALVARHDELLAAVVAAPGAYAARQAYADFLLTANASIPPWGPQSVQQRGQYLDAYMQLMNRPALKQPELATYTRITQTCGGAATDTGRSLLQVSGWSEVEHGFVVGFTTTCANFVANHARIRMRAALQSLGLSKLDAASVDQLVGLPPMPFVRVLRLVGERQPVPHELLQRITAAPMFARIEKLVLDGFAFG